MTQAGSTRITGLLTTSEDKSRLDRKADAVEMLRELAIMLFTMADAMETSPLASVDWCYVHLHGAQAASASWQHRVAERLRAWEKEDLRERHVANDF